MFEAKGDLWSADAQVHVVTTNGTVKKNGEAVMGAGVAKQAVQMYPAMPVALGRMLSAFGNHAYALPMGRHIICTMPVKRHWRENADLELIKRSALEMSELADLYEWASVAMVRPGCGNGNLDWDDVRAAIDWQLDQRFTVWER